MNICNLFDDRHTNFDPQLSSHCQNNSIHLIRRPVLQKIILHYDYYILYIYIFFFSFFFFWSLHTAHSTLDPPTRDRNLGPQQWKRSSNHWTAREFPYFDFWIKIFISLFSHLCNLYIISFVASWLTMSKIFTVWDFAQNVCQLLF